MAKKKAGKRKVSSRSPRKRRQLESGQRAHTETLELHSYEVGALPLLNWLLDRMRLREILTEQLPPDDPRTEVPTVTALLVLVRNVIISRAPLYGVGEWAAGFAPDLLGLLPADVGRLHDDRFGRCLDRLFDRVGPQLVLAVVRHVVQEFKVSLDELHNDSTSVSFSGVYENAGQESTERGRPTAAITWGYSKDHRPDLKQLLYTLTISQDGSIPLYFTTDSGNTPDDTTHQATWDLLRELVGHANFLYVADCKLASSENLAHIAKGGGRFVTVLPRSHREDKQFRGRLKRNDPTVKWRTLFAITAEDGSVRTRYSVCAEVMNTYEGYRLLWFHSTRKAELDSVTRHRQIQRAVSELRDLQARLQSPRTRFRDRSKVEEAVRRILEEREVESLLEVHVHASVEESYRQLGPGRPTDRTRYRKEERSAYSLAWELDQERVAEAERQDGIFPLLTNDRTLPAEEVLRAYKRQPFIEKRFSQFKSEFTVAPVFLKNVARIQGLLAVYFFVLLTQALLERELRRAMAKASRTALPLYPEGRDCSRPTTPRVLEIFDPVQRHVIRPVEPPDSPPDANAEPGDQVMITALTPLQRQILQLLGLPPASYGR